MRGRGREAYHRQQPYAERGVDEFHLDYCLPGDEMGHKLTILVGVERYSGMKMCLVVPTQGVTGAFAARKVIELVDECGNKDANIILKTDQEPSIKYLVSDVLKFRTGAKAMVEESPKKSSGSNGIVERYRCVRADTKDEEPTRRSLYGPHCSGAPNFDLVM